MHVKEELTTIDVLSTYTTEFRRCKPKWFKHMMRSTLPSKQSLKAHWKEDKREGDRKEDGRMTSNKGQNSSVMNYKHESERLGREAKNV